MRTWVVSIHGIVLHGVDGRRVGDVGESQHGGLGHRLALRVAGVARLRVAAVISTVNYTLNELCYVDIFLSGS